MIIDAGSRPYAAVMLKCACNRTVIAKFWSNLKLLVHPTTLEKHRQQWSGARCDMSTALKAYDDAWLRIIADSEITHGSLGAWGKEAFGSPSPERPEDQDLTPSACPHVVSLRSSIDEATLDWLTATFLWGHVAQYGSSDDGRTRYQSDRVYTAAEKLEDLIVETKARRARHCNDPARDIVLKNVLKSMLDEWEDDYEEWMRPESLQNAWLMKHQQWHQFLRKAFRIHLFQFVGCYEMAVRMLIAPLNSETLSIFRWAFEGAATSPPTSRSQTCIGTCSRRLLEIKHSQI